MGLLFSLLFPVGSAQAQGQWSPNWVPCDVNGNPVPQGMTDSNGFTRMSGTLTGSATGSQSVPFSETNKYFYYSDPINCLSSSGSVTQTYGPLADDSFPGIRGASNNGLLYNEDGPNTSITSNFSGQTQISLQAYFLWQPGYDPDNPPSTPAPPPPQSASFLLRTQLAADYANYYLHQQYDSSPDPSGGMSAQASVQDDVFSEQASVTAPAPPYAYSGGDWNASQAMAAGGLHLVTSSVQITGGKGIYTILLSGNTSAQASNSIDGTKFQAGAGSGASLDGGVKHDYRTVEISWPAIETSYYKANVDAQHPDGKWPHTPDPVSGAVSGDSVVVYTAGQNAVSVKEYGDAFNALCPEFTHPYYTWSFTGSSGTVGAFSQQYLNNESDQYTSLPLNVYFGSDFLDTQNPAP